jgi:hypothetical protein
MSSTKFIRACDVAAFCERVESPRPGGTKLATVVEPIESSFGDVVRTLLSKGCIVSLFVQDPLQADDADKRVAWDRTTNIIPDYAGNDSGSLEVWLSESMPFGAVWVEEEFIVFQPLADATLRSEVLPPGVGASKDAVIADVGSREYTVLAEMLQEFAGSVSVATLGPAFVISRGEVKRAMGDH